MNKSSCDVLDSLSDILPESNTNLHQDMGGLIFDAPYHTHASVSSDLNPAVHMPVQLLKPPPPYELTHSCHVSCSVFVGDSTQHKHTNKTDAVEEKSFLIFKFCCKKAVLLLTV